MSNHRENHAILVVEDESLLRMLAIDMFEEAGFHVLEAASGEEALRVLREAPEVSGIFTDVELSGPLDGFSLAQIVSDRHPDAAIIIVSGCRRPAGEDLPNGARFIGKPYDLGFVVRTLDDMLRDQDLCDSDA